MQAQIGADPRNRLLASCVSYKAAGVVLTAVLAGTLAGTCFLIIIIVVVYYVTRRRCAKQRDRSVDGPISMPMRSANRLTIGPLVTGDWRRGYRRQLSVLRESVETPAAAANTRQSYLPPDDGHLHYGNGAGYLAAKQHQPYQRYLRPLSQLSNGYPANLYENIDKMRISTARPTSMYPQDLRRSTPDPSSAVQLRRPRVLSSTDRQSLYPNPNF